MKVRFTKNYLTYKQDQEVELADAEASELVTAGKAVEVKSDPIAEAVVILEHKIEGIAAKCAEEAAAQCIAKVGKSFAGRKASISVGASEVEKDPQHGFKSLGHYAQEAKSYGEGRGSEHFTTYLKATGHSVGTDADGGYAVPQIWSNEIFQDIVAGANFLPLTNQYPMTVGDILNIPADNTTTVGTGMAAAWTAEGGTITPVKAAMRNITLQPYKLAILTATTDELERDAQSLSAYLKSKAAYSLNYAINNAIVRGDGSSKPTGFIGHAASVLQLRQTANTVTFQDIGNMYARFYGNDLTAGWVANPEVYAKLITMTSGNQNVFMPNNNILGKPGGTIMGIPLIKSEHASTLGLDGDLSLVDFKQYLTAVKGGVEEASSIHLYFNKGENAYRFVIRLDGKPSRAAALTPASGQGTATLSPFVVLDNATT